MRAPPVPPSLSVCQEAASARRELADSQLCLGGERKPQAHGPGRLRILARLFHLAHRVVENLLQLLELGKPSRDVRFESPPPAVPEPELDPAKSERVRIQLAQSHANRTAA
jgi:hypothetical protein